MDRFLREMDNRGARIRGKMISEQLDREFEQKIKPLLKQLRPLMKNVMYQRGLKNSLSRIANRVAKVAEKNAPLSQRPESKNPNKRSKKSIHGGASYYWKGNLKISMRNLHPILRKENELMRSIGAQHSRKTSGDFGLSQKTAQPYYWHMVEYGTRNFKGKFFMRKTTKEVEGFVLSKLKAIVERYWKKEQERVGRVIANLNRQKSKL